MAAEPVRSVLGECPDLETLAAYLDGRVASNARTEIAEHLATCESCYFIFSEAAQLRGETAPPAPPWWKDRRIVWPSAVAGLAAAATIVLAVSGVFSRPASDGPELEALVAAVGSDRTIEPRLTGGFAYGPLRTVRGVGSGAISPSPDTRIAAASIEKQTTNVRTPEALHARGIASLVTGDVDRAVAALEQAAVERLGDARILSDLGAAYLVRADKNGQTDDLARALASVNRALSADRSLAEALFNRAYALERLSLTQEARDAWQAYLGIDDRSGWADEAREHLGILATERQ